MKKIVLMIIAALAAISASAQYTNDVSRLGIRLSWDLNSPAVSKEYKSMMNTGSGFSIGGFYDIPLTESIYFEPGLSLFYNTIGLDEIVAIDADGEQTVSVDGSVRNFGFRVPLVAGYRFEFTEDIAVSFFTGPQFNIGLTSKSRYSGPGVKVSQNNYKNGWTRFDMQWLFGLRLHYADNWMFELTGGPGITNLFTGDQYKDQHLRRNIVSIGVGYIF
ncbi:MAG: PorT family protein [Bacteroides sp.]|nr:PorT family protein [Bacteroides sp.]MCM1457707.1 PorT family protein [Lachnoclostridium sp.]